MLKLPRFQLTPSGKASCRWLACKLLMGLVAAAIASTLINAVPVARAIHALVSALTHLL